MPLAIPFKSFDFGRQFLLSPSSSGLSLRSTTIGRHPPRLLSLRIIRGELLVPMSTTPNRSVLYARLVGFRTHRSSDLELLHALHGEMEEERSCNDAWCWFSPSRRMASSSLKNLRGIDTGRVEEPPLKHWRRTFGGSAAAALAQVRLGVDKVP